MTTKFVPRQMDMSEFAKVLGVSEEEVKGYFAEAIRMGFIECVEPPSEGRAGTYLWIEPSP